MASESAMKPVQSRVVGWRCARRRTKAAAQRNPTMPTGTSRKKIQRQL